MDYDPDWRKRGKVSPTQWKSRQQYLPSPYSNFISHGNLHSNLEHSDSTYASEGDGTNQSHFPHCSSPEHLGYFSHSPESNLSNEMNRNMRYPLYSHGPLRHNDSSSYSSCHQFHRNMRLNAELEARKHYSQACQHQLVNMCADPYLGNNHTTKTNHTALSVKKRRKQTNESKSKRVKATHSSNNTSVNYTYEELLINSNNPKQNCSANSRYLTSPPPVGQDPTSIDSFTNLLNTQHFFPENNDESGCVRKEHFSNIYSSNNTNLKVEYFDKILNASPRDGYNNKPIKENFVNNELEVSDRVHLEIKTNINKRNTENLDEIEASVEDTPSDVTTENVNTQIRDSAYLEEGFENVILQPIFEGKDENGEDVIVILASSAIPQEIPQESYNMVLNTEFTGSEMTDSSKENKELIILNDIQSNALTEFLTTEDPCLGNEIDSQQNTITKTLSENFKEPDWKIEGTDLFFSNINDFVSEEAKIAIGNKSSTIKRTKKKESQLPGNASLKKKLNQRKAHDNILPEDDSKTTEFENEKFEVNAPSTSKVRGHNKLKQSHKPSKFKWKSNYRNKSRMQFKIFKNLFISEMGKLFKNQDTSINRNKTWELVKNKIGCSVLQSIFTTIQQLAKSEIQKSRSTISKKK